ncbi:uncharacterized protein LOC144767339 [Lissotriton helveticus]
MEAVTVPVTIGPVIPVFENQRIKEPSLTIPLQQSLQKVKENIYPDLSEIRRNVNVNPPELTFNQSSLCRYPTGAESDSATPERSVDKIDLTQTPVGPSDKELSDWIKTLKLKEQESKVLDVAKLKVDMEELIIGTIGTDRLKTYQDDELLFLCKSITWKAKTMYDQLEEVASECGIEFSKIKSLQKTYRVDFAERDIENMNTAGRLAQIKDLIVLLRKWGDVSKWRVKWAKKKEETSDKSTLAFPIREKETVATEFPMREIPGGGYVHVPWSRQDILSFTNDFPRLREKPVEWYRQVDRFVKVSKVLWID